MATSVFNTWLLAYFREIFMHIVFDLQELKGFPNTMTRLVKKIKIKKVSKLPEHQTSLKGFF